MNIELQKKNSLTTISNFPIFSMVRSTQMEISCSHATLLHLNLSQFKKKKKTIRNLGKVAFTLKKNSPIIIFLPIKDLDLWNTITQWILFNSSNKILTMTLRIVYTSEIHLINPHKIMLKKGICFKVRNLNYLLNMIIEMTNISITTQPSPKVK